MSTWLIRSFDALLLGAVLGAMALFAPACTSLDELERVEQRLTQTRDELREEQRQLEIRLANLSPDSPLGPDVRVAIEAAAAKAQAAEAIADHMRTVVERARNPEHDPATGPAGVLTSILPAPWRVPVALGSALLVTLGRAAQLKRGAAVRCAEHRDREAQRRAVQVGICPACRGDQGDTDADGAGRGGASNRHARAVERADLIIISRVGLRRRACAGPGRPRRGAL